MLFNLDWLNTGEVFPPKSEVPRIKAYNDNKGLYEGNMLSVMPAYRNRIIQILNKFELLDPTAYIPEENYFQLTTKKYADISVGEPPTLTSETYQQTLSDIAERTDLFNKLHEIVADISIYGDSVARILTDEDGKNDFLLYAPTMWYPICDTERVKTFTAHVLCWVVEKKVNKQAMAELHVQIHEKGRYTNRIFVIENSQNYSLLESQNIQYTGYELGQELQQSRIDSFVAETVPTGLQDFAVIPFASSTTSDTPFGTSDYDAFSVVVAERTVRLVLENVVLDKHSAPKMAGVAINDTYGEGLSGDYIEVPEGQTMPQYLTWDSQQTAVENMLNRLTKSIYDLSEMGALISDEAVGNSQGYDALEIKLTNVRTKARRLTSKIERNFKKLISLISQIGYTPITPKDFTVTWHDGIPQNAWREADIAQKEAQFKSTKTILKEHFGYSEEEAEIEAEEKTAEQSVGFGGVFDHTITEEAING